MPEWLIALVTGLFSGVLGGGIAWGTLVTRVSRLERDVDAKVSRELFDAQTKSIADKLDKIEASIERLLDRSDHTPARGISRP